MGLLLEMFVAGKMRITISVVANQLFRFIDAVHEVNLTSWMDITQVPMN